MLIYCFRNWKEKILEFRFSSFVSDFFFVLSYLMNSNKKMPAIRMSHRNHTISFANANNASSTTTKINWKGKKQVLVSLETK